VAAAAASLSWGLGPGIAQPPGPTAFLQAALSSQAPSEVMAGPQPGELLLGGSQLMSAPAKVSKPSQFWCARTVCSEPQMWFATA
jgi:hypothetical protein